MLGNVKEKVLAVNKAPEIFNSVTVCLDRALATLRIFLCDKKLNNILLVGDIGLFFSVVKGAFTIILRVNFHTDWSTGFGLTIC